MMLKPKAIADYLEKHIPYTYYANEFPVNSVDGSAIVRLTGGYPPSEWSPRKQPSLQVIVRGREEEAVQTENIADQIYGFLHQKKEFTVGNTSIRRCLADQSSPIYVGRDDNDRLLYSINFTLVVMT